MTTSQLCVKQANVSQAFIQSLPSVKMNFEKLLGDKQVFQKKKKNMHNCNLLQSSLLPPPLLFVFAVLFTLSFNVLSSYFDVSPDLVAVPSVWILIHFVAQVLQIVSTFSFCIVLISVPVVPATENASEIWEAIKPEVKATIEEYFGQEDIIDEDDGPVEFQGDMDDALRW